MLKIVGKPLVHMADWVMLCVYFQCKYSHSSHVFNHGESASIISRWIWSWCGSDQKIDSDLAVPGCAVNSCKQIQDMHKGESVLSIRKYTVVASLVDWNLYISRDTLFHGQSEMFWHKSAQCLHVTYCLLSLHKICYLSGFWDVACLSVMWDWCDVMYIYGHLQNTSVYVCMGECMWHNQ